MIFICTCSQDTTTDLLLPHLKGCSCFRFNIDKQGDYAWDFSRKGFKIENLITGEFVSSLSPLAFYLRKPIYFDSVEIPKGGCLENWRREETVALFEDFYRECEQRHKTVLLHSRNQKYGKLRQLLVADRYFNVANWHMFHGVLPDELKNGRWVVKSLTGTPIGKDKILFVKEVAPDKLDLSYPWFLQEKIVGEEEVTVVYVNGKMFAYAYPRAEIGETEDVRMATFKNGSPWKPCKLMLSEMSSINSFMQETGYQFGRFDFIRRNGVLWFLELNPNGQWAWLDEDNHEGLISAIADAIMLEDSALLS